MIAAQGERTMYNTNGYTMNNLQQRARDTFEINVEPAVGFHRLPTFEASVYSAKHLYQRETVGLFFSENEAREYAESWIWAILTDPSFWEEYAEQPNLL